MAAGWRPGVRAEGFAASCGDQGVHCRPWARLAVFSVPQQTTEAKRCKMALTAPRLHSRNSSPAGVRGRSLVPPKTGKAAPMAWFVGTLVVCWYALAGRQGPQAHRHRPWYKHKPTPTFADMVAACRLQLWQEWLQKGSGSTADREEKLAWLLEYMATSS